MENLSKRLVDKSVEAFIMGLEIYNKPTIKYRIEGFSFFICNAWELMLKAHIINNDSEEAIYFKDSKDRTISLENAVETVFPDKHGSLRKTLSKLSNLETLALTL
ncbi:PF12358 family protein [Streptococcus pyogenes GA06023]|nr:PF12358 family protein [Streptococcus pyogenes GA06023]